FISFFLFLCLYLFFPSFFFNVSAPPHIYPLSLHDALPIFISKVVVVFCICVSNVRVSVSCFFKCSSNRSLNCCSSRKRSPNSWRSEEHTPELKSRFDLVCGLLLEKKKEHIV